MIIISNSQRDQIVRFIDALCEPNRDDETRVYNIKRKARLLAKTLREKKPVSDNSQNQQ